MANFHRRTQFWHQPTVNPPTGNGDSLLGFKSNYRECGRE